MRVMGSKFEPVNPDDSVSALVLVDVVSVG